MGYQSKTYSLSDEVVRRIEMIAEHFGSPNKALLNILPESLGDIEGIVSGDPVVLRESGPSVVVNSVNGAKYEPVPSRFNQPQPVVRSGGLEPEIELPAGVSVGVSAVSAGFACVCKHSGCRGAKFTGTSRFQSLCPECVEKGHSGDPRNCGECFNDTGPA